MYLVNAANLVALAHSAETTTTAAASHTNAGPRGLGVIWMMVFLTLVVVSLRFYSQIRIIRHFGLSEYLMIAAVAVLVSFAGLISEQYRHGWGRHQATLDKAELQVFLRYNIVSQSFGIMGSTFGRLSFIAYMDTLFGLVHTRLRLLLWSLFVLQVVTNGATVVCIYVACHDVRGLYNFAVAAHTHCWPDYVQTYIGYAHTSFNALTDIIMTVVPVCMIWNLQMPWRVKASVLLLLCMSSLAFVGVIMKIVYLNALSHRGDATYNTVPMFCWIVVEASLVDMAASAPSLRPMFRNVLGDFTRPSRDGGATYELSHQHGTGRGGTTGGIITTNRDKGGGGSHSHSHHSTGPNSLDTSTFAKLSDDDDDDDITDGSSGNSGNRRPKSSRSGESQDEILGPGIRGLGGGVPPAGKTAKSKPAITVQEEFSVDFYERKRQQGPQDNSGSNNGSSAASTIEKHQHQEQLEEQLRQHSRQTSRATANAVGSAKTGLSSLPSLWSSSRK